MKSKRSTFVIIAVLCLAAASVRGQGTEFSYQGSLSDNGARASGLYQLRFSLHAGQNGGALLAGPIERPEVAVSNGLFTATLDFGEGIFNGDRRWLEIAVATNGGTSFTVLTPRQEIRPAPYAIRARFLDGPVRSNALAGSYSAPVVFVNPANIFVGDGGGLTNVQATTLEGLSGANFWQLGGNAGASNSFVGTIDDQPFELRVNNRRGLRLEPGRNDSVNVIAGNGGTVAGPIASATISGGMSNAVHGLGDAVTEASTISGGAGNVLVNAAYATVGGGAGNAVYQGAHGSIFGGSSNTLGVAPGDPSVATHAFIGGGFANSILEGGYSLISGGAENQVHFQSHYATVSGGYRNLAGSVTWASTLGGGEANEITSGAFTITRGTTIAGGTGNQAQGENSTIAGGEGNQVRGSRWSTIGGGAGNHSGARSATIAGGADNFIFGDDFAIPQSDGAAIGGGNGNAIVLGGVNGTIAGGLGNTISGSDAYRYRVPGATVGGGVSNVVNSPYGTIPGGGYAAAQNYGQLAYASGSFAVPGDAQASLYVCRGITSDATPTDLFLDGANHRIAVPNNATWTFEIMVTGRTATGASAAYKISGAAKNIAGATTLFGKLKQKVIAEDVSKWDATAFACGTDNTLAVQVIGDHDTSVRWVATVRTSEVAY